MQQLLVRLSIHFCLILKLPEGLLFFVDPDAADDFVDKLRLQYPSAAIVGELISYTGGSEEGVCVIGGDGISTGKRVQIKY